MPDPRENNAKERIVKNMGVAAVTLRPYAVAIPAGAQGVIVNFSFPKHPICNLGGTDVGKGSDSSLSITSGVVFTTLVEWKTDDQLANGEYYVDHLTGKARGKKDTSGTTQSWTHSIFEVKVGIDPIAHPKKQNLITPDDSTDLTGIVTKGIMIFGVADGDTCTLNIQLEGESAAQAIPFLSNGSPYIFYPGSFKHIKLTGTTLSGATVYGLGD